MSRVLVGVKRVIDYAVKVSPKVACCSLPIFLFYHLLRPLFCVIALIN